jgi:hypothetical protein
VTVDLWDPSAAQRQLRAEDVHAVAGDAKLPKGAVTLRHAEGKLVVRAEVPHGQKPGTYAGPIVDRETGAEVGRIHVAVH